MKKTYLIEFNNEPVFYVFDEDGVISYTPQGVETMGKFFAEGIRIRRNPLEITNDGLSANLEMLAMVFSIAICRSSEELVVYLKELRDAFEPSGMKLKWTEGIIQEQYDNPKRITKEKAMEQLKHIYQYGV